MYALGSQRSLFDIPEGMAFFNTATNSPLLNASRARLPGGRRGQKPSLGAPAGRFLCRCRTIRGLAADLFGADADAWAIIPAASYGVSAAARDD